MTLQLDDLNLLDAPPPEPAAAGDGQPLRLPVDTIDEDPDQPRIEFDDETLRELAASIAERGVRQPVSVRPHPARPGRWLLNFGARRLRASKLAGRADIPAFVDAGANDYDQVIENEQREALKPLELALFVGKRLAAGESQAEIARKLGKSRAYVTMACALIDAPDWLMQVYRSGQCRGLTELYELRRLHSEQPRAVLATISRGESIHRKTLAAMREGAAGLVAIAPGSVAAPTPSARADPQSALSPAQPPSRVSTPPEVAVSAPPPPKPRDYSKLLADSLRLAFDLETIIDALKAGEQGGDDDAKRALGLVRSKLREVAQR